MRLGVGDRAAETAGGPGELRRVLAVEAERCPDRSIFVERAVTLGSHPCTPRVFDEGALLAADGCWSSRAHWAHALIEQFLEVLPMSRLLIELRAGEGGRDAELFCLELRDAIVAYARKRGGVIEDAANPTSRTLALSVEGPRSAYEHLCGVHRIQRIPKNGGGRRHTSTATVAVLDKRVVPVLELRDDDLSIDTYRASGNGGQKRNKTDSAVRVTHLPTGMVVTAERERSQWQNLQAAKAELRSRIEERERGLLVQTVGDERKRQIQTGERPAKDWTHNAQRGEVLSHASGQRFGWCDFYAGKISPRRGDTGANATSSRTLCASP